MFRRPIAKLEHLGKLVGRVDVQYGKWHAAKERLVRQPDENVRILPHRPWHDDIFERVIRLAKNENALALERVEVGPCGGIVAQAHTCTTIHIGRAPAYRAKMQGN